MKKRAGEEGEILKRHNCSAVCILSFTIAMANSLGEMKGVTPGTVGNNDRKRLSMQMSQAQAEQLEELDSIRIKTMYQMVEDVQISHEGLLLNRKLLYLTNKQARSFNVSNIKNVFEALELPSSHFVIQSLRKMQEALTNVASAENEAIFESAGGDAKVDKKSKYVME